MATARSRKGNISEMTTMLSGPMPMASGTRVLWRARALWRAQAQAWPKPQHGAWCARGVRMAQFVGCAWRARGVRVACGGVRMACAWRSAWRLVGCEAHRRP